MRARASGAEIASRTVAAVLGGYALAATFTVALAGVLPRPRAEAVALATLSSFTVYVAAGLWAFAARSAVRAWLGVTLPTLVCGVVAWLVVWSR